MAETRHAVNIARIPSVRRFVPTILTTPPSHPGSAYKVIILVVSDGFLERLNGFLGRLNGLLGRAKWLFLHRRLNGNGTDRS
jgi:hypothetical protein